MDAAEGRQKQKPVSKQGRAGEFSDRDELQTFQCLCFHAEPMRSGLLMRMHGGGAQKSNYLATKGTRVPGQTYNQDLLRP